MKKLFLATLLWILSFSFTLGITVSAQADTSQKIYDDLGSLTQEEINQLANRAVEIGNRQQVDLVFVLIHNTGRKSSRDFADDFYDENGFGYGTKKTGLLLLLNQQEREVYISTAGSAISVFTDSVIDKMLDHLTDAAAAGDYALLGNLFFDQVDQIITQSGEPLPDKYKPLRERYPIYVLAITSAAIGLLLAAVVVALLLASHKRSISRTPAANLYIAEDSFQLTEKEDIFLHSHVTKIPIPKNTDSGGSTTHKSSGGKIHGGGGRKF